MNQPNKTKSLCKLFISKYRYKRSQQPPQIIRPQITLQLRSTIYIEVKLRKVTSMQRPQRTGLLLGNTLIYNEIN